MPLTRLEVAMTDHCSRGQVSEPAMKRDRAAALFARIGARAHAMGALLRWMRQAWGNPHGYRPGDHYMRGPGPKWREKHGHAEPDIAQQPMLLGDKWDF
jgi:hypothetical protein